MALPPLASVADFEERYEAPLASDDLVRVEALLRDVSAEIRQVCAKTFASTDGLTLDVPEVVVMTAIRAALDHWRNPKGYTAETLGSYSYQLGSGRATAGGSAVGLYLKAEHLAALGPWLPAPVQSGGLYSLPLWV